MFLVNLHLFDGGAGAATGGTSEGANQNTGGNMDAAGGTHQQRGKAGDFAKVLYGKQPEQVQDVSDAGRAEPDITTSSNTLAERMKSFQDMIHGEYRDIYNEEVQKIVRRRVKDANEMRETIAKHQPVIDMLMQRYHIENGDVGKLTEALEQDDAMWEDAAYDAGMTIDQYKQFQKLRRENQELVRAQRMRDGEEAAQKQLQEWYREAEEVKNQYPDFDLQAETQNPQFLSLLKVGVPMDHAYKVLHMEELMSQAVLQAEQNVVSNVRAKGTRPRENGTSSYSSDFVVKSDVHQLTKEDRARIAEKVAKGATISF